MIRHLFQILRLLGISLLAGAAWVAQRPADLPQAAATSKNGKADDLLDLLRQTTIKRAAIIEISEADINRHLASILTGKLSGMSGGWASFEGARVKLEQDYARLIMFWNIHGHTRTASVDLAIQSDGEHFHVEVLRGAYGHLNLPRGMMRPLYPAMKAVEQALDPELRALFQMTKITIAKDKLVLDPRFPSA